MAGIKIPLSSRGNVVWCAIGVSLLTTVRELFDNGENALLGNQTLAYIPYVTLRLFSWWGPLLQRRHLPTYAINSIAFFLRPGAHRGWNTIFRRQSLP